ncbi:MAG: hypothetical protein LBH35_08955, partial [Treponema sp.]|nr:hypothetical protein [Treponema sp.]
MQKFRINSKNRILGQAQAFHGKWRQAGIDKHWQPKKPRKPGFRGFAGQNSEHFLAHPVDFLVNGLVYAGEGAPR